jgi:AAA family ATP:ADP antiporter
MFAYFFLVVTTFWILKPIKKAVFYEYYAHHTKELFGVAFASAAHLEQIAKVANMVVAYGAVVLFAVFAQRLRRERLTWAFSALFAAGFVLFGGAFFGVLPLPRVAVAWSFYLYGDLFSTLMVATFFAFLNDAVAPEQARRLYGPIVLGGVVGGAFGATSVAALVRALPDTGWMFACVGLAALIAAVAAAAGRRVRRGVASQAVAAPSPEKERVSGNPALAGLRLVAHSRYLLAIVAIVGLFEIVSTLMDFQYSFTVEHYAKLGEVDARSHFATTFAITNVVALVVQLGVTSLLMSRFPLGVSLSVLPTAAVSASALFALAPGVLTASLLNVVDGGLSYSIHQSAKEALYTVASAEEKYQAKAFIDMFVQRAAKAVGVGLNLTSGALFASLAGVRLLTLVILGVGGLWLLAARHAGLRFQGLSQDQRRS